MSLAMIITGLVAVLLFIILYIIEIFNFAKTGSKKYSFFNYYPFELNCFRRNQKSSYIFATCILAGCLLIALPFLFFAISRQGTSDVVTLEVAYAMFALSIIASCSFAVLNFAKLSNYALHLVSAVTFAVSVLVLNVLIIIFFGILNLDTLALRMGVKIAVVVISVILALFEIILMINRTYKNWARMEQIGNNNIERPKYWYLCILEWGTFLNYILTLIPLYLIMFF